MYCKDQEALGGMVFSYTDSDGVSKIEHEQIKNKQQQIKPLNLIFLTFNYQNNIQNIVKCHLYSSSFPYIHAILR